MPPRQPDIDDFWDGLAEFAPAQVDAALNYALSRLAALIDVQQAYWLGSVRLSRESRDPLAGWRPAAIHYLHPHTALDVNFRQHARLIEQGSVDPSIVANVRGAGSYRINIQREIVPPEWFESEFYRQYLAPFGIQDALYMVMPLGEDVESWFGFQRIGPTAACFGDAERQLLDRAGRSLKWFHRRIALSHGLRITEKPLTPTERRLLGHLLGSATEAGIADAMGLTPATVHTYATRIYRKFNVQGRTGLAALWLGR